MGEGGSSPRRDGTGWFWVPDGTGRVGALDHQKQDLLGVGFLRNIHRPLMELCAWENPWSKPSKSHLWGEKEKQLGMLGTKHRFYVRGQTPLEPKEALKAGTFGPTTVTKTHMSLARALFHKMNDDKCSDSLFLLLRRHSSCSVGTVWLCMRMVFYPEPCSFQGGSAYPLSRHFWG